jgi:ATP-dependent Clp endopeptidase proteolytic subunit ClpP
MKNLPEWLKVLNGDLDKDDEGEVCLLLSEPIGEEGWTGMSSKRFGEVLNSIPSKKKVTLQINTRGGQVDEGLAMYNMIRSRGGVSTCVIGFAASMGSIIAQAGAVRKMMPGTIMMIHNPQGGAYGESEQVETAVEALKKCKDGLVEIYHTHNTAKLSRKRISELMDETTFMTPREAVELGFADESPDGAPAWNHLKPIFNSINLLPKTGGETKPKSMKKLIAALAALIKLPEDVTDETAAPQVENALKTLVDERDSLQTENENFKAENKKHEEARKTRVTNRVQKAIDAKLIKAERKDALIASGIANESVLDFLDDLSVPAPQNNRRGAPAVPPEKEGEESIESLRTELKCSDLSGEEKTLIAKKLRELRGHGKLFATQDN